VAEGDGLLIQESTSSPIITFLKALSSLSFVTISVITNPQKLAENEQVVSESSIRF
jgi:hypothetical protein